MKYKFFLFIIFLFFNYNFLLCCKENKTDWEVDNLKGKIKEIERITNEFSFNDSKMEFMENEIIKYNSTGKKTEHIQNKKNTKYYYDKNNNLIKEDFGDYYRIYKYNNKNLVIEELMFEKATNKLNDKRVYIYDSNNNLSIYEVYQSDILYKKWIFKYDKISKELEHTIYNADGSYENKYMFKYNNDGKVIEIIEQNLQENEYYTYDKKGNIASYKNIDGLKKYEYDDLNNLIKEIVDDSFRTTIYYYQYTFDSHKNIISLKVFLDNDNNKENKILYKTIESKIKYY